MSSLKLTPKATILSSSKCSVLGLVPLAMLMLALSAPATAEAASVIKRPGAHPKYNVEIEPHLLLQWTQAPWGNDGFGPGVRLNIPLLDNGPIKTINNNMAIGVGLDWAIFGDVCGWWWRWYDRDDPPDPLLYDCDAHSAWVPVVLQWNFFLTDIISVFGEPGLAVHRFWWNSDFCDGPACDGSDTELEFVFWAGGRFLLDDTVSIVVRLGTPYVSAGVSFLL